MNKYGVYTKQDYLRKTLEICFDSRESTYVPRIYNGGEVKFRIKCKDDVY